MAAFWQGDDAPQELYSCSRAGLHLKNRKCLGQLSQTWLQKALKVAARQTSGCRDLTVRREVASSAQPVCKLFEEACQHLQRQRDDLQEDRECCKEAVLKRLRMQACQGGRSSTPTFSWASTTASMCRIGRNGLHAKVRNIARDTTAACRRVCWLVVMLSGYLGRTNCAAHCTPPD